MGNNFHYAAIVTPFEEIAVGNASRRLTGFVRQRLVGKRKSRRCPGNPRDGVLRAPLSGSAEVGDCDGCPLRRIPVRSIATWGS